MPFQLIYSVEDDSGDVGETAIDVPITFNLSQYGEFATAMATFLDAILSGKVTAAKLCFNADLSGLTGNTADSQANREAKASFQYMSALGYQVGVNVPGCPDSVVLSGSDDLNLGNAAVAAFDSMMLNGLAVTGGTIVPCDVGESDITSLVSAREEFVSSGRRG